MEMKFKTTGMMCAHCSGRVEKVLAAAGVNSDSADHTTGIVTVDSELTRDEIKNLIEQTGYDVVE